MKGKKTNGKGEGSIIKKRRKGRKRLCEPPLNALRPPPPSHLKPSLLRSPSIPFPLNIQTNDDFGREKSGAVENEREAGSGGKEDDWAKRKENKFLNWGIGGGVAGSFSFTSDYPRRPVKGRRKRGRNVMWA